MDGHHFVPILSLPPVLARWPRSCTLELPSDQTLLAATLLTVQLKPSLWLENRKCGDHVPGPVPIQLSREENWQCVARLATSPLQGLYSTVPRQEAAGLQIPALSSSHDEACVRYEVWLLSNPKPVMMCMSLTSSSFSPRGFHSIIFLFVNHVAI